MTTRRDVFKFFGSLAMAIVPARVMNQYIDPPFTPAPRYPVYEVPEAWRRSLDAGMFASFPGNPIVRPEHVKADNR